MTTPHRSPAGRPARRRRLATTTAALLLATGLIGCGAKGGSDASPKDTTPKATTTTTKPVTDADLKAALPTAKDLGGDYRLAPPSEDDSSDTSSNDAIDKACPDAKAFFDTQDKSNEDDISAKFETADNRTVETAITRDTSKVTKDNIDEIVAAINKCTKLSFTESDGTHYEGQLSAEKVDNIGDFGMKLTIEFVVSSDQFPVEIPIKASGVLWVRGKLGGSVLVTSGFDKDTLKAVPGDVALQVPLSQAIDSRLKPLAD